MSRSLALILFVLLSECCLCQTFVEQTATSIPDSPPFGSSSIGNWCDYNNDGLLDFIIGAGGSYQFAVYQNKGDNTFERKSEFREFELQSPNIAEWGDYDGDGYLDLLLGPDINSGRPFIYKNNKDGSFTKQPIELDRIAPLSGRWVDLDNDGDNDIVMVGAGGGDKKTLLYRNDGEGKFSKINHNISPAMGIADVGDFDQDGDPDLLVTQVGDNLERTEIYVNDGNGVFTKDPVIFPALVSNYGTYAKWIDAENDGDLDIYLVSFTNSFEDISILFINEGASKFDNQITVEMPISTLSSPVIGDVDNDGIADILVMDWYTPGLLKNNGNLFFSRVGLPLNRFRGGYVFGDSDNDLDLDLLVVGGYDTLNATHEPVFYKNETVKGNTAPGPPSAVTHSFNGSKLNLSWTDGFDAETATAGLSYNIYLFNNTTRKFVTPPHADTISGFRKVVGPGNAGTVNAKTFNNLGYGSYSIGVQSLDGSYVGSMFAKSHFIWGIAGKPEACANDTITYTTTTGLSMYNWNIVGGKIIGASNSSSVRVERWSF